MGNLLKGEVVLEDEGKAFVLLFDYNALCDLEGVFNAPAPAILNHLKTKPLTATQLRALLWSGLREHHPEVVLRDAGRMIHRLSYDVVLEKVMEGYRAAFPAKEDAKGDKGPRKAAPPTRRRGASPTSSEPGPDGSAATRRRSGG